MIFKTFSLSDNSCEIKKLSPKEKNHLLSRNALKNCLQEYDPCGNWDDVERLQIIRHHHMFCNHQLRVSLSHTKNVGAALLCHFKEASSVGIDIEFSHRKIKFGISRFFKNLYDKWDYQSEDQILWAWSLKEAAFKAISPLVNHHEKNPLLLKHIWITENDFGLYYSKRALGRLEKKYNQTLSLNIALAFLSEDQIIWPKM